MSLPNYCKWCLNNQGKWDFEMFETWYSDFPEEKCAFYQVYASNIDTICIKILEWYIKEMACEHQSVKIE